jgi:hypothetical protein
MTSPSVQTNAIDFSHYLPPGVYTNPQPGPQLAVNQQLPTAVGIIGTSLGYRTFIETIQVNPDEVGAAPVVTPAAAVAGAAGINDVQVVTIGGAPTGGTFSLTFSGQTTVGINDIQTLTFTGNPQGGTVTITFSGQTTSALSWESTAGQVQTALQALSSIGSNNISVTGPTGTSGNASGPFVCTFGGTLGTAAQPAMTLANNSLTGGTSPSLTITHTQTGSANIPYNATAAQVSSYLTALSTIQSGNISVTGATGGPYTVTFIATLGNSLQPVITLGSNNFTGGTSPGVTFNHLTSGKAPINAQQTITVVGVGGSFTLTYGGITTVPIAYNAPATSVSAALQGLSSITSGGCAVSGSSGGPYTVQFTGVLGGQAIALLIATPIPALAPAINATLAQQGINLASILVKNPNSGVPYVLNTDYTVINIGGTNGTSNATYTIERILLGAINPGDYVQVSYQYTDPTYFTPYIFYDYADVVACYGPPFNLTTGTIQSGLTLMAKFAFLNGAYQVVCVAVQAGSANPGFTPPGTPTVGDYGVALSFLADQGLIGVVVADTGQQPFFQLLQEHVDSQSTQRFERRGICGLDGTVTAVPSSQRIIDAQELNDPRIMLVCPAAFNYFSTELNYAITIGGQYMAAALAGMTMAMSFAMPLTRKRLTGFLGVAELEITGQKNLESQNGLCVIEVTKTQQIQVRHGLSTDPTDLISREWSITGQQDAMCYTLRAYLESDNLIGQPIYPYTLINVWGSAEAALQVLIVEGLIVDYTGLSVRQLKTNPDVLEVSYEWLPAFPLNYIVVTFSVSLTTGSLNSQGTTANQTNISSATPTTQVVGIPTSSSFNDFGGASNTLQSFQ